MRVFSQMNKCQQKNKTKQKQTNKKTKTKTKQNTKNKMGAPLLGLAKSTYYCEYDS